MSGFGSRPLAGAATGNMAETGPAPSAAASSDSPGSDTSPRGRIVFSASLFGLSVLYLVLSFQYPAFTGEDGRVGPGLFPTVIASALVLTTALSLIRDALQRTGTALRNRYNRDVAVTAALSLGFVVLTLVIGAIPAASVFTFVTLLIFNRDHWVQNVAVSAVMTAVLYLLLVVGLDAPVHAGYLDLVG